MNRLLFRCPLLLACQQKHQLVPIAQCVTRCVSLLTLQSCDSGCYLLSQVSVSLSVLATASYSVSYTVLAFTFASAAASF